MGIPEGQQEQATPKFELQEESLKQEKFGETLKRIEDHLKNPDNADALSHLLDNAFHKALNDFGKEENKNKDALNSLNTAVSKALSSFPTESLDEYQQTDKKTLENLQILLKPFVAKYQENPIENKFDVKNDIENKPDTEPTNDTGLNYNKGQTAKINEAKDLIKDKNEQTLPGKDLMQKALDYPNKNNIQTLQKFLANNNLVDQGFKITLINKSGGDKDNLDGKLGQATFNAFGNYIENFGKYVEEVQKINGSKSSDEDAAKKVAGETTTAKTKATEAVAETQKLDESKTKKNSELNTKFNEYKQGEYSDENRTELITKKDQGIAQINSATNQNDIGTAFDNTINGMKAIQKTPEAQKTLSRNEKIDELSTIKGKSEFQKLSKDLQQKINTIIETNTKDEGVENQINLIKNEKQKNTEKITDLNKNIDEKNQKINSLEGEIQTLEKDISFIKTNGLEISTDTKNLLNDKKSEKANLEKDIEEINKNKKELMEKNNDLDNNLRKLDKKDGKNDQKFEKNIKEIDNLLTSEKYKLSNIITQIDNEEIRKTFESQLNAITNVLNIIEDIKFFEAPEGKRGKIATGKEGFDYIKLNNNGSSILFAKDNNGSYQTYSKENGWENIGNEIDFIEKIAGQNSRGQSITEGNSTYQYAKKDSGEVYRKEIISEDRSKFHELDKNTGEANISGYIALDPINNTTTA